MKVRYLVPEGMRKAFGSATGILDPDGYALYGALEEAIRWLSENPIVPTEAQQHSLNAWLMGVKSGFESRDIVVEWQRRMFLAPEPEVPEAVKDLLRDETHGDERSPEPDLYVKSSDANKRIIEAYRRGRESK